MTSSWDKVLEASGSCAHFLEFTRPGERRTGQNSGRFLAGALKHGGIAIAVATPVNATAILAQLARMGLDPVDAIRRERLQMLDSAQMLSRFLDGERIDEQRFDATAGTVVRSALRRSPGAPLRAFGDMVGILWDQNRRQTAIELEQRWNVLQKELGFGLFCGYPIDVFGAQFTPHCVEGVLDEHTHVLPGGSSAELGRALDRAIDDVLGAGAIAARSQMSSRARRDGPAMPKPEQIILWLRGNLPEYAQAILERTRELYDAAAPRTYLRQEHSSA